MKNKSRLLLCVTSMYHSVSLLRDFFALLPEGEADAQCHKMNYFDPASQVTILALERGTGSTGKRCFITLFSIMIRISFYNNIMEAQTGLIRRVHLAKTDPRLLISGEYSLVMKNMHSYEIKCI